MEDVQESAGAASSGIPAAVIAAMEEKGAELTKQRKKRSKPADLTTAEAMGTLQESLSQSGLHGSSEITSIDVRGDLVLTGGNDKKVVVFSGGKVAHTLSGHTKKVTTVAFHAQRESVAVSGSADKTVRVWSLETNKASAVIKGHTDAVTGVTLSAPGTHLVSVSADSTWAFSDIDQGKVVLSVAGPAPFSCAQFHPDGLILGTGLVDGVVRIWDVKSQQNVANFEGHKDQISSLCFSENGFYLATGAKDATVKIWDLRKLKNIHTITAPSAVHSVAFDHSGQYLAVGGEDLSVYMSKSWDRLATLKTPVGALRFGPSAHFIAASSARKLLFFKPE
jgi:pre-mRNA-processing factor 19